MKKLVIVSHYSDITNIFHIFSQEVLALWNESKSNINTIVVLKNYKNNNVNKWRLGLLKSLFKKVYTGKVPKKLLNGKFKVINVLNNKYNKWLTTPFSFKKTAKSRRYIKMANIVKKKQKTYGEKAVAVAFVYRKNNRRVYDYESKELVHVLLKRTCKDLSIPFKSACFDNMSFAQQAKFMKNVKVLISPHGAALTNLFMLPQGATIFEISFRKYWFCDPVCDCHVSGKCAYTQDCHTRVHEIVKGVNNLKTEITTGRAVYHKADFYNLAQLFGVKFNEIALMDAKGFFKTPEAKEYNPINLYNLYIDYQTFIRSLVF